MKLMKKYRKIFFFAHQMLLKQTLTTKSIPKPFLGPFIWRNLKWNSFKLQFVTRKIWLTEISFKYPPNFLTPEGPLIVEVLHTPKRVPLIMQKLQFSFIEGQMQWKKKLLNCGSISFLILGIFISFIKDYDPKFIFELDNLQVLNLNLGQNHQIDLTMSRFSVTKKNSRK